MTREDAVKHLENMKWLLGVNNTTVDDIPLTKVIDDIAALLKAQEPRVMTLDEYRTIAEKRAEERVPVWLEWRGGSGRWTIPERAYAVYGVSWRCWTSRPDEKRRAETPWE